MIMLLDRLGGLNPEQFITHGKLGYTLLNPDKSCLSVIAAAISSTVGQLKALPCVSTKI